MLHLSFCGPHDVHEGGHLGALGVKKIDLDLIERSRKVSHFSLQATHPESSSERVLTARRYPKLGDQRFESMTKVCLADRSASMPTPPTTQSLLSLDGGCHHDELNPTVLKVILVSCVTVAAGMCHSQMRHFEGICSLAGVEFFFACGGLRAGEARQQHDRRAGERDALTRAAFESVELLQPCMAMRAQCSCLQCPMQLLASCVRCTKHSCLRATRDLRAIQNYETSITL